MDRDVRGDDDPGARDGYALAVDRVGDGGEVVVELVGEGRGVALVPAAGVARGA